MTDTGGNDPFFARPVLIVAVALIASLFKIGIALATSNKLNAICGEWALVPWLTLVGGLFVFVLSARRQNPHLRFLSLTPIEPQKD